MSELKTLPERERFSLLYGRQGSPGSDSKRMRKRLGILIHQLELGGLYALVRRKLGVDLPVAYQGPVLWEQFFEHAEELRDVLDTITLAYDAIQAGRQTTSREAERFLHKVNLIFQ